MDAEEGIGASESSESRFTVFHDCEPAAVGSRCNIRQERADHDPVGFRV